jgi:hypothetical protein
MKQLVILLYNDDRDFRFKLQAEKALWYANQYSIQAYHQGILRVDYDTDNVTMFKAEDIKLLYVMDIKE